MLFVAVWAFRGGILLLFVAFWGFRGGILHNFGPPLVGPPPQVAKNGPFSNAPIQRIYQRRGQVNFLIFGLVDVDFLHFGFAGLHFLLFCLSGLHFSFWASYFAFGALILALRGGIFLAFWALFWDFLAFWPFVPSFPFILAFWAFISFHFGLFGLHLLSFWLFGPSFSFILAFFCHRPSRFKTVFNRKKTLDCT